MPNDNILHAMKRAMFRGTEKNYDYYIDVLHKIGISPRARVFDFGCSWGYGSFQLTQAGFNVTAYEVAPTRRRYAMQKLDVHCIEDLDKFISDPNNTGQFDCFFSAHVLEHIPAPARAFQYAHALLRKGGVFVSFTPNGSEPFRSASAAWSRLWGEVHPNFIDVEFLEKSFNGSSCIVGSSPIESDAVRFPDGAEIVKLDALKGDELVFAARKNGGGW